MIALVPCPEILRQDIPDGILQKGVHEGFWLVSQDPSVIREAGSLAIVGESLEAIREQIDRNNNLPMGFTMTVVDTPYFWRWTDSAGYGYGPTKDAEHKRRVEEANKYFKTEDKHWQVVKLCSTPQTCQDMDEYKILVEARGHPKGIITTKFKLDNDKHVQIYKNDYVIEYVPGSHSGKHVRVVYSPERAKRLAKLRARNANKGQLRATTTCFEHLTSLVIAIREVILCEPLSWLYYEKWSGRGIDAYSRAIAHFYQLAVLMNRKAKAQKVIAKYVKPLCVHETLLRKTASEKFVKIWEQELKRAGGRPKNLDKYLERKRSKSKFEDVQLQEPVPVKDMPL